MRYRDRSRLPGGPGGDVRQGLWRKGDRVLYWNLLIEYMETWVMIRSNLTSSIPPPPQLRFRSTWYRRKAMIKKNPTAQVARSLVENSLRTSGFTEGLINQP